MEKIKIGGCYQTRKDEFGWILITGREGKNYNVRDIEIDGLDYDEEIRELSEDRIREMVKMDVCFRPYYKKGTGLYAVWDESLPLSEKRILHKIITY